MAFPSLATIADLQARGIAVPDPVRAVTALDGASEAVRDAAGCPIVLTTSTVTLYPGAEEYTSLPGGPVRSITGVTVRGVASSPTLWALIDGQFWSPYVLNSVAPGGVLVTYTHGYDRVPEDIIDLVCSLTGASILSDGPRDPRELAVSIDDYRVSYGGSADAVVSVMELPERTREMLARRFSGGGVYVTGR